MASGLFIKRLELSGFKSFVKRTVFTFDAGLTAIIGPNGCGKSNIIDAIRWVLGEQSAKSLRGARMDELIFHGSEKEKPVGMAEVTLTIDNEAGQLKKQGPEISLTRRLYRSGESEYLINKSPVRLKDITDVILDTGVTTGAYMIMEQGKIDQVLTARPTERMSLFEEAAGVMRYQLQKEEAQRKLEATRTNLVRVGDIVHELKRQLDSLERQAKHAEQYQEMRKRAQDLRARKRAVELSQGRVELTAAEEAVARARSELETVRASVTDLQASLQRAREAQEGSEREVRELDRAIAELRETQRERGAAQEDVRRRQVQLSVLRQEREGRLGEVRSSRERVTERAQRAREGVVQDESSLVQARERLAAEEARARELESRLLAAREDLASRRTSLGTQADQLHQAGEHVGEGGPGAGPLAEFREEAPSVEWPLAGLFKCEEKHRQAVLAALGPLADAAVVQTWEQARALLQAWREQREAPLALVVAEAVGEPAPRGVLPDGAAAWADEVISCPPKHASLARALLGGVALVEGEGAPFTRTTTVATSGGVRVTPNGVVWWPGTIPGARAGTGPELAMLLAAAVRELGEVESKIVEAEADLSEARRHESAARVEAARIEQRLSGRRGEHQTLAESVEETESQARRLEEEVAELDARERALAEEMAGHDASTGEIRRRLEEATGRLSGAQERLESARKGITQAEEELDAARGRQEALQGDLVALEARFYEVKNRFEMVKHEFAGEFGSQTPQVEDLARQPLTEEEASQLAKLEAKLADMGQSVNLLALDEFQGLNDRYAEYQKQIEDLRKSRESLQRAIYRLDRESEKRFERTFETIRENFHAMFRRLFGGGDADLKLVENEEGERGIDIEAKPPGKRTQSIALLSGGERALVSTSLLFSLYMTKPSPFCFMDELDAPLDDANTDRFMKILREFVEQTQFVMISHNKHTMEMVDSLYGITMEEPGVSKILSVKMRRPPEAAVTS